MPGLCVHHDGDFYLPALDLWVDATTPRPRTFVSHAHTDHYAAHEAIVCSPETSGMLSMLSPYGETPPPRYPMEFHKPLDYRGARIELLQSGHILGAAMLHVELGDETFLYAGDIRPSGSQVVPPAKIRHARQLVVEDTFGAFAADFLEPREGAERVVDHCHQSLSRGATPIVVTTGNCGKTQEIVQALVSAGLRVALQPKIFRFCQVFARLGVSLFGFDKLPVRRAANGPGDGGLVLGNFDTDVVVVTRSFLEYMPELPELLAPSFRILVSGWALSEEAEDYDASVPWSDHASRDQLLRFVEDVRPEEVWTFAGRGELVEELRRRGYRAQHFGAAH